jgi:hypothetical protein
MITDISNIFKASKIATIMVQNGYNPFMSKPQYREFVKSYEKIEVRPEDIIFKLVELTLKANPNLGHFSETNLALAALKPCIIDDIVLIKNQKYSSTLKAQEIRSKQVSFNGSAPFYQTYWKCKDIRGKWINIPFCKAVERADIEAKHFFEVTGDIKYVFGDNSGCFLKARGLTINKVKSVETVINYSQPTEIDLQSAQIALIK